MGKLHKTHFTVPEMPWKKKKERCKMFKYIEPLDVVILLFIITAMVALVVMK